MKLIDIKEEITKSLKNLEFKEKVDFINDLREHIHNYSPFKNEPVDFVRWVSNDKVIANEYNPNKVAPPEMELLEISITNDGYTQPIVTFPRDNMIEVVDGFHRHRVGKESKVVNERIKSHLPIVAIRTEQSSKNDRIASTIRHNRARGKHVVDAMSEIVLELKNRNWKNKRIAKELGMDEEEILRLCQITGLEDIFKDDDFSKSWNIEDSEESGFVNLTDEVTETEKEEFLFRTTNTSDPERIFHTFDKWECQKAGFYENKPPEGLSKEDCENEYAKILTNEKLFRESLDGVLKNWKHSCEHYLTNKAMNRIAWLGQASLCYSKGIPSSFKGGWNMLSKKQQDKANLIAHEYLNEFLKDHNLEEISIEEALSVGRQVEIY